MRMTEHNGPISVSALRAQIQEKLLKHSVSAGDIDEKKNDGEFNGNAPLPESPSPRFVNGQSNVNPIFRPPIPPHHSVSGGDLQRFSSSSDAGSISGISAGAKPPIAPKPKDLRKSSLPAVSPANQRKQRPSIILQRSSASGSTDQITEILNGQLSQSEDSSRSENTSVRGLARQFEMNGSIVPRIGLQPPPPRPESTISSFSMTSRDTESDTDDERPAELVRPEIAIDLLSPNKIGMRRPSALCFNGDSTMHDRIMDELKRQGVVRASTRPHIFKKKGEQGRGARRPIQRKSGEAEATSEDKETLEEDAVVPDGTIPTDVGKLREDRKPRVPDITLSSSSSAPSEDTHDRTTSILSDRSSTFTNSSNEFEHVLDYDTGDPEENKRLKKLHYAANEFYTVQKSFLKYLTDMAEVYPKYLEEYGNSIQRDLLAPTGPVPHVVRQLQSELRNLIPFHQFLLEQFAQKTANWTSVCPSMAEVVLKHADFLKMCKSFLKEKSRYVKEMTVLREENKDFDNATICFEQKIFKRGVGAVVMQLDQVHQNFMRYKILMMSYSHYLHPESEEFLKANEAIAKLETVTQSVNEAMGVPTNTELMSLYERFQYHFDVFRPGRRLIRQGEVLKQTRKEPQPRYLVLFSDYLWVCRVASSVIMTTGLFDLNRSYQIPVDTVRTDASQHEDFEKILYIKSKEKSCTLIFKNVKERDQWSKDINSVRDEKKEYKRRMSSIPNKGTIVPLNLSQGLNEMSRTSIIEESQDSFCNSASPSVPSTPIDDVPGPSTSSSNGEHPLRRVSTKRVLRAERDKPLWIPDEASTKCLMDGCGSVFTLLNRRHHCRDCGWLICSACSGRAPLNKYDFRKELVCPECFDKISEKYQAGTLFPNTILVKTDEGWKVRIKKNKKKDSGMVEVLPQFLFVKPHNYGLKRVQIFERVRESDNSLVFSKVFVKTRKGTEMQRYAMLTEGMILQFFKAQFDSEPCEQHVIYGFDLKETELDAGGTEFELVHRNQIRTDRKEHVIIFRVEHAKSVTKWSNALNEGLGLRSVSQDDEIAEHSAGEETPTEPVPCLNGKVSET